MNKIAGLIGVTLLTIILLQSCSKEQSLETGGRGTGAASGNDSTLLTQFIELDTSNFPLVDTISQLILTHDNLKRVTKITQNNVTQGSFYVTDVFYNGTDTLPYKTFEVDLDLNTPVLRDTLESYLSYDASGRVVKDSSVSYGRTGTHYFYYDVHNYIYSSNGKIIDSMINKDLLTGMVYSENISIKQTSTNGNITAQLDTSSRFGGTYGSHVISYDNHPNPLYKAGSVYGQPVFTQLNNAPVYTAKNNWTNNVFQEISGSFPTASGYQASAVYTYKSNGYPASAIINDPSFSSTVAVKAIYIYGR